MESNSHSAGADESGIRSNREKHVISNDCVSCGVCEYMCPLGAIVETRNQFSILKRVCDGCAICVPYCPVRAIVPKTGIRDRQDNNVAVNLRRALDNGK